MGKSRSINSLPVSEIFESIQGEGRFSGVPSIFLRTAGCNLRCTWCDTKYSWKVDKKMTMLELKEELGYFQSKHLVITGGEPMLYQDFWYQLTKDYEVEIETNGTISPKYKNKIYYSVSPKLSSSGNDNGIDIFILKEYLAMNSIFKFVISTIDDWYEMLKIVEEVGIPNDKVWIMPEGVKDKTNKKNAKKWMPLIVAHNFRFSPRLQVWLWGKKKGF